MLRVLIPEVEGAVAAGGGESAVLRVKGNGVNGVDFSHVAVIWVVDAVAFKGEICTVVRWIDLLVREL